MSWALTALGSLHRHEEEIEFWGVRASRLNEITVDNAATGRVVQTIVAIHNEEVLDDTLVDDHKGDFWLYTCLVIHFVAGCGELGNLGIDDLLSLSSTHTVAIDNDVGWEIVLVVLGELFDTLLESSLHLSCDYLLALLLDEEI